jgi:hypothetical protein
MKAVRQPGAFALFSALLVFWNVEEVWSATAGAMLNSTSSFSGTSQLVSPSVSAVFILFMTDMNNFCLCVF